MPFNETRQYNIQIYKTIFKLIIFIRTVCTYTFKPAINIIQNVVKD